MKREIEIEVHNPKVRLENLKKLSGELVDYIEKNFQDLLDEDVNILTNLLEVKLKKLFREREKEKNKDEFFKYLEIALKNTFNATKEFEIIT